MNSLARKIPFEYRGYYQEDVSTKQFGQSSIEEETYNKNASELYEEMIYRLLWEKVRPLEPQVQNPAEDFELDEEISQEIEKTERLMSYTKYKENLKTKYRFAFVALPVLTFIFYYSIVQFVTTVKTGSFFLHPILSGGLIIVSFFLIFVVVASAWRRDKLESEINKKIEAI